MYRGVLGSMGGSALRASPLCVTDHVAERRVAGVGNGGQRSPPARHIHVDDVRRGLDGDSGHMQSRRVQYHARTAPNKL